MQTQCFIENETDAKSSERELGVEGLDEGGQKVRTSSYQKSIHRVVCATRFVS